MKRRIAIFVAFAFLAMQVLSFQHMAAYGFKEHTHKGKTCEIAVYFNQSNSFDSASNVQVVAAPNSYILSSQVIVVEKIALSFFALKQNPRAPPHILPA